MNDVNQKEKHHPLHYCERNFREFYSPGFWAISFAIVISILALMLVVGIVIFHFADLIPAPIPVWIVLLSGFVTSVFLYWLLRRYRRMVRELDVKIEEAQNPLYYTERFFRELYSPREWAKASAIVLSIIAAIVLGGAVILLLTGSIQVTHLVLVIIVVGCLALPVLCYWLLRRTRRLMREVNTPLTDEPAPAHARDR